MERGREFRYIKQRLTKRASHRRKSIKREGRALTDKEYFFVVLELIRLFRAVTIDGIEYVVKDIFSHDITKTVGHIGYVVAILVGTG